MNGVHASEKEPSHETGLWSWRHAEPGAMGLLKIPLLACMYCLTYFVGRSRLPNPETAAARDGDHTSCECRFHLSKRSRRKRRGYSTDAADQPSRQRHGCLLHLKNAEPEIRANDAQPSPSFSVFRHVTGHSPAQRPALKYPLFLPFPTMSAIRSPPKFAWRLIFCSPWSSPPPPLRSTFPSPLPCS